jgi:thioesterase domain-containing protein
LAGIWSAVLGITSIDRHQNFFELGGHSLLAMQVVSRIRTIFQVRLSLRHFFANPTIEGIAKQINHHLSARNEPLEKEPRHTVLPVNEELVEHVLAGYTKERKPELIQLHEGDSGSELFFLVDEGSLGLFKLAHLLHGDCSVFASLVPLPESALKASVNKQTSALPSMEELAAYHVSLILSRPANGPLLLAGRCFGGNLAFEVAHQLQRVGRKVDTILMVDTWMSEPNFWWKKKAWLKEHVGILLSQDSPYLFGKSLRHINLRKDHLAWRLKLATNGDFNVHVPWIIMERIFRHAMDSQLPKLLDSRGLLFISEDDWLAAAYRKIDDSLGVARWMARGVEIMVVPGDHLTVLDEARLPKLAECFKKGLEKLRSRPVESQEIIPAA